MILCTNNVKYKFISTYFQSFCAINNIKYLNQVELLENLEEILENIYTTQCEESLAPLFNKYNEVVSSTVLNFTAQMHIILNGMDDQPKLKFDQITEATVRLCKDLEMLYDLGYKVIPDYFHPARILKPDWKLKPGKNTENVTYLGQILNHLRNLVS